MKISQLPDPISPILSNSELETSSSTLSSPLFLPSDTITLLDSFYADLAISNQKLKDLADQANSKLVDLSEKDVVKTEKLSVDEFRALFGGKLYVSVAYRSSADSQHLQRIGNSVNFGKSTFQSSSNSSQSKVPPYLSICFRHWLIENKFSSGIQQNLRMTSLIILFQFLNLKLE